MRNHEIDAPDQKMPVQEVVIEKRADAAVQGESSANQRPTAVRYGAIAWLVTAAALAYLTRNSVGVAESRIRDDLGLTLGESGWFMGAFFWTYALFQVPTGSFSHRFGTRLALSLFALGWSIATFATAIAPGFWLLIAAQLLTGVAQAGIFPASTKSIKDWMPMSQRSFGCGLLTMGMQLGAVTASVLTGELLGIMSWRWVFVLFSIPGVVWTIGFAFRFRDRPELSPRVNEAERRLILSGRPAEQTDEAADDVGPTDWGAMLRHPGLWLLYGQQICRAAGYMFFASWFPTFLQQTRGVSIAQSGYMQSAVLAGSLTGGLFGGLVVDWIWKRTGNLRLSRSGVASFAMGTCGLLILASWFVEDARLAIGLLTMGTMLASLAGAAMFAAVIDISGGRVAQVLGAVNMIGNFAVALCPILVGKLFEQTSNWNLVLVLFAGLYLLGGLFWAFFCPRRGIFNKVPEPAS
ncbi:putative sulfoacetate transporter SauU [Caulifigura coniformis]|uniref:Putative sulfoacetate transporter SauU n=1 Tax=Caulifigura coniformis TaxID=2527983 RepID=A0A517SC69_9PLAN|nr:MFS transporter [Caulifigura coniformis]QDT53737.1 putative sulfoacetate transporter SauU [Caulifigura coniformis]